MSDTYSLISLFGLEMNPPKQIDLGFLSIRFYGLIIACGLLLALLYACKRSKQFGISSDDLVDGALCIVPFAILCARLYYCAFKWDDYRSDPISVLYIWQGGLAIYGGVIGAVIGALVFCKIKKIKYGALMDLVVLGLLIGQSIGRWGNFFNREAFGEVTDGFFKMGLFNQFSQTWEYHHPTFLYESLWNAAGFVALHFLSKKRQYDGQIALGYVAWYGLGRTFIEGLRMDSLYWGTVRVSQMLAAVSCFAAAGVLVYMAFRKHDPAKMQVNLVSEPYAPVYEEAESGMEPLILEREEDVPTEPEQQTEQSDVPEPQAEQSEVSAPQDE